MQSSNNHIIDPKDDLKGLDINSDQAIASRHDRLLRFYLDDESQEQQQQQHKEGSGAVDHKKAQEKIASILRRFYYKVELEKQAIVDILGPNDIIEGNRPFQIDVLAAYPRSKLDKGDGDICDWTIRYAALAVEIDTSASKRVKGHGKTGHKSRRAHKKDDIRSGLIAKEYGIDIFVRFEATDISQEKRFNQIGELAFLEEMGITKYPYDVHYKKGKVKNNN